ncbi:MAG: ATP-binding cassette domain-containing protein [Anaerolineaceae bacterium]|nr:ATP-binding cassette domain-containing protein [Anaerolineaceae bacterium]
MTEAKPKTALSVLGLSKSFGELPVIEGLSFEVQKGERLLLLAACGAGKSTLLKILAGLLKPDQGSHHYSEGVKPVILFQEPRLFSHLTVQENILLPLKAAGKPISKTAAGKMESWLAEVNLYRFKNAFPHELSGGMKRKVSLLRALITEPNFLLLDEPFQSLDPESKEKIINALLPQLKELTILFTTHDILEIPLLASSVLYFSSPNLAKPAKISAASFGKVFTKPL